MFFNEPLHFNCTVAFVAFCKAFMFSFLLKVVRLEENESDSKADRQCSDYGLPDECFDYTALGGTFDNIHTGHKILLSTALALTKKSMTIGITMPSMNKSK